MTFLFVNKLRRSLSRLSDVSVTDDADADCDGFSRMSFLRYRENCTPGIIIIIFICWLESVRFLDGVCMCMCSYYILFEDRA